MTDVKIEESWKLALKEEFEKPYFTALIDFIKQEKLAGKIIYPPGPQIFSAFDFTPINEVKVVILGQDPYHGPNQAHGMCFSVPRGTRIPPSLQNIYKELERDGFKVPKHGIHYQFVIHSRNVE